MSYISGQFNTFEPRLHHFAISGQDIIAYRGEVINYTGLSYVSAAVTGRWIKEFIKKDGILGTIGAEGIVNGTGLLSWYQFDEGIGTKTINSSYLNLPSLSLNGNGYSWTSGKFNNAVSFSNNAYASSTSSNNLSYLMLSANFTLAGWFKLASTGQAGYLLTFRGVQDSYAIIYGFAPQKIEFFSETFAGVDPRTAFTNTINDTNWHHFAWTYNGANLVGYLDGFTQGDNSKIFSLNTNGDETLRIATSTQGADFLNVTLDSFRIYNRSLTSGEVFSLQGKQ